MMRDKIPIPIKSVTEGSPISFDLYIFITDHFLLYKKEGDLLTKDELQKFSAPAGKALLYIDKSQIEKYRSYLENESGLEEKERISIEENLIKNASQTIIQDLFNLSDTESAIESSKTIVNVFMERLNTSTNSLANLMKLIQHDYYTFNHSIDVCAYTIIFANELLKVGYLRSQKSIKEYALGGLLHDIGKREIPIEVINKPTRLSTDEWELMKTHSKRGADIIRNTKFSSVETIAAAEMHHEQIDGQGYPYGKKGREIPLVAKVVSICDVFDALTTKRTYSPVFSPQKALHTMRFELSNKFDTELMRIFEKRVYPELVHSVMSCQEQMEVI